MPRWPRHTDQPGDLLREIFERFGADAYLHDDRLSVHGQDRLSAIDVDLH